MTEGTIGGGAADADTAADADSAALLERARAGDGDAFAQLTDPYKGELVAHCYRILGSFHDAQDACQDALLAAWQGLDGFEGRSSVRTWLYRIATNRALNLRRGTMRRAAREWEAAAFSMPEPSRLTEITWLAPLPEPYVDALPEPGPEARYELRESVSLAFITALQHLPPRQLAVLVLRDVLGFSAVEVAAILDATVPAVHSALKRARASLGNASLGDGGLGDGGLGADSAQAVQPDSAAEAALLSRFVAAFEARDLDGLISLFTDDAFVSMPPMPCEYVGHEALSQFYGLFFGVGRDVTMVPRRANGQPAYGLYARDADGIGQPIGILVLALAGDRISAVVRFNAALMPTLDLPETLAAAPR